MLLKARTQKSQAIFTQYLFQKITLDNFAQIFLDYLYQQETDPAQTLWDLLVNMSRQNS